MARSYRLGTARRAVNAMITALLKIGVGPKSTYLMTTTGRRSGQPRTTPVTLVENGTHRWLVAPYGTVAWVHNVRANPTLQLRRGRRREQLHAEELDAPGAGPVLRRYVREVAVTRPYFDAGPDHPATAFTSEAAKHPVFELKASRKSPGSATRRRD